MDKRNSQKVQRIYVIIMLDKNELPVAKKHFRSIGRAANRVNIWIQQRSPPPVWIFFSFCVSEVSWTTINNGVCVPYASWLVGMVGWFGNRGKTLWPRKQQHPSKYCTCTYILHRYHTIFREKTCNHPQIGTHQTRERICKRVSHHQMEQQLQQAGLLLFRRKCIVHCWLPHKGTRA